MLKGKIKEIWNYDQTGTFYIMYIAPGIAHITHIHVIILRFEIDKILWITYGSNVN